jgi:serine/threonine protein phosphatase PrpC
MSEVSARQSLIISFGEACDRGKIREENQDSVRRATIPLGELFIVADGIGGYQGGATASRMVVEEFHAQLAARPADYPADDALREASAHTNASIHTVASSGDPSLQRMGSTVVVALVQKELDTEPVAWIGHVGDSRAYLIREGEMSKVTSDHSAVQALLSRNLITEEEARNHPDASVLTRSLGHKSEVEIELDRVSLQAGDALLLCSDGLWGYVAEGDIAAVVSDGSLGTQTIADTLLHQALAAGGQDNIGIEFIRIAAASEVPAMTLATTLPDGYHPVLQSFPARAANTRAPLMAAVAILLLAGCGVLGYAAYHHKWPLFFKAEQAPKNSNSPAASAAVPSPAPGHIPGPGDSSSRPAVEPHAAVAPDNRQISKPPIAPKPQDKSILVVGGISVGGDEIQLPPKTIHWKHLRLARDSRPACAALSESSPVMYAPPHENIVELFVQHPELATLLRSPPRPMTPAIKRACGDADIILILPRSASGSR